MQIIEPDLRVVGFFCFWFFTFSTEMYFNFNFNFQLHLQFFLCCRTFFFVEMNTAFTYAKNEINILRHRNLRRTDIHTRIYSILRKTRRRGGGTCTAALDPIIIQRTSTDMHKPGPPTRETVFGKCHESRQWTHETLYIYMYDIHTYIWYGRVYKPTVYIPYILTVPVDRFQSNMHCFDFRCAFWMSRRHLIRV